MSSIVKGKSGKYEYRYESISFRRDGKRVIIGKVNPATGDYIYKTEYIERMKAAGTPVATSKIKNEFSVEEMKTSVIKEYGAFDSLRGVHTQEPARR